jgi:hypothetical protein
MAGRAHAVNKGRLLRADLLLSQLPHSLTRQRGKKRRIQESGCDSYKGRAHARPDMRVSKVGEASRSALFRAEQTETVCLPSVASLNYVKITSSLASASLARRIFSRILRPDARQTYFFGFRLRSTR